MGDTAEISESRKFLEKTYGETDPPRPTKAEAKANAELRRKADFDTNCSGT